MENKKAKLTDILNNIKTQFREAIKKGTTGVAYMYIVGDKVLSVSVENIEDDTTEEAKKDTNVTKVEEGK